MAKIRLNIDGTEVTGYNGQTILEIAGNYGIEIPTLCNDERVKMYGACGVCVVEVEGMAKLVRSCSTFAADGMTITTNNKRVIETRTTALELLMSDHNGDCRPPCTLACPGDTDCQGYVGLIANGEHAEALNLIKNKVPLPASIGRVCPHPCETACRRQMVEEPISIASLKSFVADKNIESGEIYTIPVAADTGKSIAVIGGGPAGVTAAYFLRAKGHSVTIYDAMPEMGGMLRYGIPEYRLPKTLLLEEINAIKDMGVKFVNNVKVGKDTTLEYLQESHNAVVVAIGAWQSSSLRCPGEDLNGVIGGIDFLRDVAMSSEAFTGQKVAVVGGGNTAMDACRAAVRLGATEVYNIYRRTKSEMPAEDIEIKEAEEEGVIFKNLANPIEVTGDGRVEAVRLQLMELGEADASGRRAPVPIPGQEEVLDIDTMIIAVGQQLDGFGFEHIAKTNRNTIAADEKTFATSIEGVFAVGDATNKGADIAITAIGEARKAAAVIDDYLNGVNSSYEKPYYATTDPAPESFANKEKCSRATMPHRTPDDRKHNFKEVNFGLSEEQAINEASRCLECGCMDFFDCKLIGYANDYKVAPEKYDGEFHTRNHDDNHPYIKRNPDKCILCGLCVRVCEEVVGTTVLGLVDRGFDTIVKPAFDKPLQDTDCISCGQCISVCPTGALTENMPLKKQVPLAKTHTSTTCSFCSVGCQLKLSSKGNMMVKAVPENENKEDALLCMRGRFGFGEIAKTKRIEVPLIQANGEFKPASFQDVFWQANREMRSIQTVNGNNAVAVSISDRYTSEEIFMIKEYATETLKTDNIFCFNKIESGLKNVTGRDASTLSLSELEKTDLIILVNSDIMTSHLVAAIHIRRAVEAGAKLIVLNDFESAIDEIAFAKYSLGNDSGLLAEMTKYIADNGGNQTLNGFDEMYQSLTDIAVSPEAESIAKLYMETRKAAIVFEQNKMSVHGAELIGNLALLSDHYSRAREGILQLKPNANSQGLADLGIGSREEMIAGINNGEIKGLMIFGEDIKDVNLDKLEFLAVEDIHLTETAKKAHMVIPGESFAEVQGHYTDSTSVSKPVTKVFDSAHGKSSFEILKGLIETTGTVCNYQTIADVTKALEVMTAESAGETKLVPVNLEDITSCVANTNEIFNSVEQFAKTNNLFK